jgi:hypothetical protein
MLLLLFRLLTISFAFHFYKNRYPKEYEAYSNQLFEKLQNSEMLKPVLPYIIKFGYAMIYIYSFFQILLNKVISKCLPYVKIARDKTSNYLVKHNIMSEKVFANVFNSSNTNAIKTIISFYNEGALVSMQESDMSFKDLKQTDIKSYEPQLDYNLLVISDKNENKSDTNILTFINKTIPTEFSYELSNIKFIALYLKHDDKTYSIDLYHNSNNNYIIGNVFNNAFFKYYLTNVLNIIIDNSKPFLYELELMDHNVSMVCLNEKQSIIIEKDDYKIVDNITTEKTLVVTDVLEPIIVNEVTNEVIDVATDIIESIVTTAINDESILNEDIKEKIE